MANSNIKLYHYTTKEGAQKIDEDKSIVSSDPNKGDAVRGPGVYLTRLGPEEGKTYVSKNNWDGTVPTSWHRNNPKVEHCVEIDMPKDDPNLKDVSQGNRNIFLYKGNIDLRDYPHDIRKT